MEKIYYACRKYSLRNFHAHHLKRSLDRQGGELVSKGVKKKCVHFQMKMLREPLTVYLLCCMLLCCIALGCIVG